MTSRRLLAPAAMALLAAAACAPFLLSSRLTSHAVQNPTISLDMVTAGTSYDSATNTMTVGAVDNCLTSATANTATHLHTTHVVIENVEDLIGWQVRLNYFGDKMRPNTVNFIPFIDNNTAQNISFNNLPIEQSTFVHRDLVTASTIPAAPPDGTNTRQTASFGASYGGAQDFAVSPDTPAKATPDDSSYSAPSGGVLGTMVVQVVGNESGNQLFMNVDNGTPNGPGSGIAFFNGTSSQDVLLPSSALGDGFHGEGVTCVPQDCVTQECPPPASVVNWTFTNQTGQSASDLHVRFSGPVVARLAQNAPGCPSPVITSPPGSDNVDADWGTACVDNGESVALEITSEPPASPQCFYWTLGGTPIPPGAGICATPTPTPTPAGHDSRLTRISGVPKTLRLSTGTDVVNDTANVTVANQSAHEDTIGVYVDVLAPAGCIPNGRVAGTMVTLAAGVKTTIAVPVSYNCSNPAFASGLSFTWVAVADHGADDLASCGPGTLQGVTCFNALADDDEDPADNRLSRNGPRVVAQ